MAKHGRGMLELYRCTRCGAVFPVRRFTRRGKGHRKTLWCVRCKASTVHVLGQYNRSVEITSRARQ